MENTNTVMSQETITPATVFAFAPEDMGEVGSPVDGGDHNQATASDLQGTAENAVEETTQTAADNGGEVDTTVQQGVSDPPKSQKDVGKAFAKERARLQKQYEERLQNDKLRALGKLIIEDIRSGAGADISEDEAIERANANFLDAIAKREGISTRMAQKIFQGEPMQPATTEEDSAQQIVNALEGMEMPTGFDKEKAYADPDFINLLLELPADKAVRLYHAEHRQDSSAQDLAEKLKARQALPQSMKPQQAVTPVVDWTKADSADFFKEKERRQQLY